MKKILIACAVVLAGILSSCSNTNYCYEITQKTLMGDKYIITSTTYFWGTSNELDAYLDSRKDFREAMGMTEDSVIETYKKVRKSESDCTSGLF